MAGSGTWIFGATENGGGNAYVPPGGDNESWNASGSENDMFAAFRNAGHFHSAGYYAQWRCHTIPNTAVGAAIKEISNQAGSGYVFPTNNCLTKSVAILNAYGEGLGWPAISRPRTTTSTISATRAGDPATRCSRRERNCRT